MLHDFERVSQLVSEKKALTTITIYMSKFGKTRQLSLQSRERESSGGEAFVSSRVESSNSNSSSLANFKMQAFE